MSMLNFFVKPIIGGGITGYIRHNIYDVLRRIVPSVRERHRLEVMIGPVGYWRQIQKYQFNFLTSMGLKPHHTLLDIGCGPLSGGLAFIPYLHKGNYVGIDIRKEAIAEAHIQLAKASLAEKNPFLAVSSTFGREELGNRKFDYIWASQILYHLDEGKIEVLFKQLSALMKPTSKFYSDIIGYPNKVGNDSHWHEFTFHLHTFDFLKAIGEKFGFTIVNIGQLEKYGYPATVALKTNDMLEFSKKSST